MCEGDMFSFYFFLTHHVRLVKTRFWTWCKKVSAIIATKVVTPINQNALMWQVSIYASLLQSLFPSSFHWEGSLLKQSEGASQGFVGIVDIIGWYSRYNSLDKFHEWRKRQFISSTAECHFYFENPISSDSRHLVSIN